MTYNFLMTEESDPVVAPAEVLKTFGFSGETRLYRHTLPEFLESLKEPGVYRISANPDPSEAIVDVYGGGHGALAVHIGAGLAFAESIEGDWRSDDRVAVVVQLQDVLDQGGRVYPVESVITARVWYLTFPEGGVRVRKVGAQS
jgi:hypothetical protein